MPSRNQPPRLIFGPQVFDSRKIEVPKSKPNYLRRRLGAIGIGLALAGAGVGIAELSSDQAPKMPIIRTFVNGADSHSVSNKSGEVFKVEILGNSHGQGNIHDAIETIADAEGYNTSDNTQEASIDSNVLSLVNQDNIPVGPGDSVQQDETFFVRATQPIEHPEDLGNDKDIKITQIN